MADSQPYQVLVHLEDGSYWAEVTDLPGCFASGDTEDELLENLLEAIGLYLSTEDNHIKATLADMSEVEEVSTRRILVDV